MLNKNKLKGAAAALLAVITGYLLLLDAQAFAKGVSNGLTLCAGVLVPSLFPFMALTQFISLGGASAAISKPLRPLTKYIFNLPEQTGSALLMSGIGGYPAAAAMIGRMARERSITRRTAERMLCFCVNAGPSFLIGALGAGLLGSVKAGTILYLSQLFSSLLIGFALSFTEKPAVSGTQPQRRVEPYPRAFTEAVTEAAQAVFSMCAFVLIFSALLEFLKGSGLIWALCRVAGKAIPVGNGRIGAFLTALIEITAGSAAMAGRCPLPAMAFATAFGGVSVIFQISGQLAGSGIRLGGFAASRLLHGALSAALCALLLRLFPEAAACMAPVSVRIGSASAIGSAALMIASAVFLLTVGGRRRRDAGKI